MQIHASGLLKPEDLSGKSPVRAGKPRFGNYFHGSHVDLRVVEKLLGLEI